MSEAARASGGTSISDVEFRLFQRLMFDEAGVTLSPTKKALVSGRLAKRLQACGCPTFADYHRLIGRDDDERQQAIDLLTTNETYFFREPKHFEFIREQILPTHPKGKPFRVWSAACSSGEEAYSIAMTLADILGEQPWSITGSDLNTEVLAKARAGHYGLGRTQGISQKFLQQYCLKGKGSQAGTFLVGRGLRSRTEFRQVNLNEPMPKLEPFDLVFLRNVMIYFSQETKVEVVRRVIGLLKPGGYFFIGHSESLHGVSDGLEAVRPSIYRKPT